VDLSVPVNVVCPNCNDQGTHQYSGPYEEKAVCNSCAINFTFVYATIRVKKSRGNKRENTREFDIRIYLNDGSEKLLQFENSSSSDIELRAKDPAIFVFLGGELRIIQNVLIKLYTPISKPKNSNCYIATYLYGTSSNEVVFLKNWRDNSLQNTVIGKKLIALYYIVSPILIKYLGKFKIFNVISHAFVQIILKVLNYKNT